MNYKTNTNDASSKLAPYEKVQLGLQKMLVNVPVGTRIWAENDLAKKFDVSRPTVRKAAQALIDKGILVKKQGKGTFLRRSVEFAEKPRALTKLLGVSVPTVDNSMVARIVEGAEMAALERGYNIVLVHDHGNIDLQIKNLENLLDRHVDGLITYPDIRAAQREDYIGMLGKFAEQGIPSVIVNCYVAAKDDLRCVMVDDCYGMYSATEHLVLSGRRRFALLGFGSTATTIDRDRRNSFLNALADYKLTPTKYTADLGVAGHEESAYEVVTKWINQNKDIRLPFDAIVCMQDNMAYGAYMALKDAGFSVPDDVALVGFDNLNRELYSAHGLELTSVDQPAQEIGTKATEMVIDQVEGKPIEDVNHLLLRPKLIIRTSCGHSNI